MNIRWAYRVTWEEVQELKAEELVIPTNDHTLLGGQKYFVLITDLDKKLWKKFCKGKRRQKK